MIKLNKFSSFFVANWKLNGNIKFIDQFIDKLSIIKDDSRCVVICPTSIHLYYIGNKKKNFCIGAQNVSSYEHGPYTGEISCNSLSELKIDFCIVGHSERRKIFHEKNIDVNLKSTLLISKEIIPIICIGETLNEKENGQTYEVLKKQMQEGVCKLSKSTNTIIAYEPIWAIGTGLTPSLGQIDKTHEFIRTHNQRFKNYKILYGGSVKASNAKEILSLSNVDGLLVGGASLKYDEFKKIIKD